MSPSAVTMYWPVLLPPADPPSLTLTASSLVSASRCCHEAMVPFRVPFSSIVVGSHSFTVPS
eukprot:CAMPEP_0173380690 /NCGR_PEP_ID=MMETSP1356-20130122/3333_1 /TAXON_ID=77927 ORGANISM="Hemiselmis virescens, Strain PCC157" /NCGR_SAMPLE_ID=MMETSP1356 /ASSEMBLY_ACC=CAM_ASM_000847 /LENGTH=61 /DNA_ID=CAMNT_0014334369 /DNA_START=48 /DNA_END=230 /DNA_ORIENTATION=+